MLAQKLDNLSKETGKPSPNSLGSPNPDTQHASTPRSSGLQGYPPNKHHWGYRSTNSEG
jgi:hypothetical protein